MHLRRALLLVPFLAAPAFAEPVAWKTKWPEALAEAKKSNKCALLFFFNDGVKRSKSFETETLGNDKVLAAMRQYVCARIDPEGPDEDNMLWQKHQMPPLPMTYIYDPGGTQLASVRATEAEAYAKALDTIAPVYAHQVGPAREALAKDPDQPDALAKLASAYLLLDNPVESAKCYTKAADVLVKKGDKAKALAMLTEQLEKYYEQKWYVPARDCCKKLAELDPGNETKLVPKAIWVQGMADCTEGKWNDAIAVLKPACDKYKDSDLRAKMMFSLASAYMYGGNKATAADIFDAIIKEYPDTDTARIAATQVSKIRK
jgi:tetratricopeptide (TPR) repeat protein